MSQLFQRSVKIILGTTQIEDLRVQLKVKHTKGKEPNECQLTIYNLSQQSRSALQSKGTRIVVEAGYVGTIAQIFSGHTRFIDHTHEGPLWLTKVQSGDGEFAYAKQIKGSFKKGTPVSTVFEQLAQQTGLDVNDAIAAVKSGVSEQFTKGYTSFGKTSTELDKLLLGRGFEWSMQDGKLQVLAPGAATRDTAIVLSPSTGLIGSPSHGSPDAVKRTPAVLTVKSLLQPSIRPGRKVKVESEFVNGLFLCTTVTHDGDTAGGSWYSEAEVTPL